MNKKWILLLCALVASASLFAVDKTAKQTANPLLKSDTVIWAGLDYSMVRMYGTMDFKEPEKIFPDMFDNWNGLFLTELVFHESARLQKAVGKTVKPFCEDTHIKDADITEAVRSYKLTSTSGLGLVFIVDRLVKAEQRGAVYLVYFDVATREVIAKQRVIVKAAGFGFRNYWFRVPKDALRNLKKLG